ncbi:MAG: energy transducer TonB [Rikenellaceae bacterium]
MKSLKLILSVLALASLCPTYAKMDKAAKKEHKKNLKAIPEIVPPLSDQLQTIRYIGGRFLSNYDDLTSVVSFEIKTDKYGKVTDRAILTPISHWSHAKLVYNYLKRIKYIPKTDEEQVIQMNIDLHDLIPQDLDHSRFTAITEPIKLPTFRGSDQYDDFIREVLPTNQRILYVARRDTMIRVEIKHNKNGEVRKARVFNEGRKETKNIGDDSWSRFNKDWTPALVNGVPHTYIGSDMVNLRTTLSDDEYKQALAMRDTMKYDSSYLIFTEVMPTFKGGGIEEFRNMVMRNLTYPTELAKSNISGQVIVSFIVNVDGTITIDKVLRSPNELFSQAVIDAIQGVRGKWTPGQQDGKYVRIKFTIPVNFSLNKPNTRSNDIQIVSYGTPRN